MGDTNHRKMSTESRKLRMSSLHRIERGIAWATSKDTIGGDGDGGTGHPVYPTLALFDLSFCVSARRQCIIVSAAMGKAFREDM